MNKFYHRIVATLIYIFKGSWESSGYKIKHDLYPEPYTEDGFGHNHEWDDMYHTDENGQWVHKGDWAYCWICGQEEEFKRKEDE